MWRARKSPEGPYRGEALHCLREVGEEGQLGAVLQLLQVPDQETEGTAEREILTEAKQNTVCTVEWMKTVKYEQSWL